MTEKPVDVESRKAEHIFLALEERNQASGSNGLDSIRLIHEALPELNLDDVSLVGKSVLPQAQSKPLYVNSMTAGNRQALDLNIGIAQCCLENSWFMGLGSQRRQLWDRSAEDEIIQLRREVPQAIFVANIGMSQLISTSTEEIKRLVDSLEAQAIFVHTNPLQEALQKEGTPQFRGGCAALTRLCKEIGCPVILKEVGTGISAHTLQRLKEVGLFAVDVSGLGGTHWGRIEGDRAESKSQQSRAAKVFAGWGISTVQTLLEMQGIDSGFQLWASGGVRSGLDAAKLIALGASAVGFAKPVLENVLKGSESLDAWMKQIEYEMRLALFCTGCTNPETLREKKLWQKI
jgi:isopentenyl-diphosphate delta-isomerase